ncbi:OmpA family protein [Litoribacter ruber]|uniref:OmpA family protein n=1 Tax=Litoribacter ruber TaxID=702568 RepID=UPI001BDA7EB7|nr:OmpA family protein [Litoribacter ruber]MBT0811999.1 OmpA family protein [Litoribacter ruber]
MKKLLLIIVFFAMGVQVFAQNSMLRYADRQFEELNYREAAKVYSEAYRKKARYSTAQRAAQSFEQMRDYGLAYKWRQIAAGHPEASTEDWKAYAMAAQRAGEMDRYFELKKELEEKNVTLVSWENQNPNRLVEAKPLDTLNTGFADFGWAEDYRGNIYITSDRGEIGKGKRPIRIDGRNRFSRDAYGWTGRDFLTVYKVDQNFQVSEVQSPVPDTYHFSDPFFLKEQPIVFYTVTREVKGVKKREYDINPELYYSRIDSKGEMVGYEAFPYNSFLEHAIITPFVDEESKMLYFASNMKGGHGGLDLYYVEYDDDLKFGEPVNLGPAINTAENERNPFVKDGHLYFSSEGHEGLGGLDILKAAMLDDGFAEVENLGLPYNSPQDDYAYFHKEKGKAYFSSDRLGGKGLDDIYTVEEMYKRFLANLLDCDGNEVVEEFFFVLQDRKLKSDIHTDRDRIAKFTAELNHDSDYLVKIHREGYFSKIDSTIFTKDIEDEILERFYTMIRIPYRMPVFVDLIYYDLDKSEIRTEAKPALDKLAEMMNENDFLDLQVNSHTDVRASEAYNEKLSQKRAESVVDYLVEKGVSKSRITPEWHGKKKPVRDCGEGQPCSETDHQLNRRSELVLRAFPESGKDYDFPIDLAAADCDENTLLAAIQDRLQENGLLALPRVYFDFDKYTLRLPHKMELEKLALWMQQRRDFQLDLQGHTDIRGSEDYNKRLSERRAQVVFDYLKGRGVDENRMAFQWFGKTRPVVECSQCTEEQHQANRRTEVRFSSSDLAQEELPKEKATAFTEANK